LTRGANTPAECRERILVLAVPQCDDDCVVNYSAQTRSASTTMPTAQTSDRQPIDLASPDTDPALVDAIRRVLRHGQTIDITTIGRRSGLPRRIEIALHSFDRRLYISGMPSPRTRAWLHNLRANPGLTIHLKQLLKADLGATAREITDPVERREVLTKVARVWRREVEPMERFSPLVEVTIDDLEGGLERGLEGAAKGAAAG
jgi:deazaflavin-dependent oxidoreductase (nitroreductase family)